MPFIHKGGHLTKAFQKEKRRCKSIAKNMRTGTGVVSFGKIDKFGSVW